MDRETIDAVLRRHFNDWGVQWWWTHQRPKLAYLSADTLFELRCFETIKLEIFRRFGERIPDADGNYSSALTSSFARLP